MDYSLLRGEGIRLLERMSGGEWTDFNAHDPGITLLEQICYVLSDLAYRTGHPIPDLLSEGGKPADASLHAPDVILSTAPVTLADTRRILLDIEGVKNAWVEPAGRDTPSAYFLPSRHELQLQSTELAAQPIFLRGLYRVFIEPSGDVESSRLRALAAERLHSVRPLGEDLAEITILQTQLIQVDVTLEVAPLDNPLALLAQVRTQLAEQISPDVPFQTASDLISAGLPFDEIFEGPRLSRGILHGESPSTERRRLSVYTSDLMHALKNLPLIRAVSRLRISQSGAWEEWSLAIEPNRVPRLDAAGSKVTLRRGGQVILRSSLLTPGTTASSNPSSRSAPKRPEPALLPPPARARNVGHYTSLQAQLPMLYGIGESGLPDSASDERKAKASQLKAYLLLFDQICANQFCQLAHLADLLSYDSPGQTYFTQAVDHPGLGLDAVRTLDDGHRQRLQRQVETADSDAAWERKNRFLNHLLARFAEPIADYAQAGSLADRAAQKQALLNRYPQLSSTRGQGGNILRRDAQNGSGLEARLALDLGLRPEAGEQLILVEHIFLRPLREDFAGDAAGQSLVADRPLLARPPLPDPYSLQVSFVLPEGAGRFSRPEFRGFIEDQLRQRLPAQIFPYVNWLDADAWGTFREAYDEFQRSLHYYLGRGYGVALGSLAPSPSNLRAIDLRGARDRVIDLLHLGETYPIADTDVHAESLTVGFGMSPTLSIDPAQKGVRYQLCEQSGEPVAGFSVDGDGTLATLHGPNIQSDHTYRLRAHKIDRPERFTYLVKSVPVKIGINTNLPLSMPALSSSAPVVDYGAIVHVRVGKTQAGVRYLLINPAGQEVSADSAMGNGGEISLYTQPLHEDTVLRVEAIRDTELPDGQLVLNAILDSSLPVAVRANPAAALSVLGSPIVDHGSPVILCIANSQSSVTYSAHVYSLLDTDFVRTPTDPSNLSGLLQVAVDGADPVYILAPACPHPWQAPSRPTQVVTQAGNDGELRLTLPSLQEDSVVLVKAQKSHSAAPGLSSALQLTASLPLLCRPAPVPELSLQGSPSSDGVTYALQALHGQPGVFYYFRQSADSALLGLPAYFHKTDDSVAGGELNRGLGQAWFEVDLVIARDPSSSEVGDLSQRTPESPIVDLSAPPLDGTLHVLAVKARTRVAWTAGRMVPVTSS